MSAARGARAAWEHLAGRLARRRGVPFCEQTSRADCGAACLVMVLAYHGRSVPLDEVQVHVGSDERGANAARLLAAGRAFGLRGQGVRVVDAADLAHLPLPAILHWRFQHFVVLERLLPGGRAGVLDPGVGRLVVDGATLSRSFTGVALLLEPGADFTRSASRPGLLRHLARLRPDTAGLLRVGALTLLLQALALGLPLIAFAVVERVVPWRDQGFLAVLAVAAAVVALLRYAAAWVRNTLVAMLRARMDAQLARDFLERLLELPHAFFAQRPPGDLLTRLEAPAALRQLPLAAALLIVDGPLAAGALLALVAFAPGLGLLALALGLGPCLALAWLGFANREHARSMFQSHARTRSFHLRLLEGMENLKLSGTEPRMLDSYGSMMATEVGIALGQGRFAAHVAARVDALASAAPLVFLLAAAHETLAGRLRLSALVALLLLAQVLWAALRQAAETLFSLQAARGHWRHVLETLDAAPEQAPGSGRPAPVLRGALAVEGLSFRHDPAAPLAIAEVGFTIEPGELVALVGPSGAGKSTLAGLLLGLHKPAAGRVLYDGHDLWSLDLRSLRRQVGVVPQRPRFFGGSVREVIGWGASEAPLAAVIEAARLACIHDDILALPLGYETLVSDGATFSGGQRQRLALARALLLRPRLLVLDEATSALEATLEAAVQRALASLSATRLLVTRRLSSVRHADRILVLAGGRLVESGRHAELVARDGVYAAMWRAERA